MDKMLDDILFLEMDVDAAETLLTETYDDFNRTLDFMILPD